MGGRAIVVGGGLHGTSTGLHLAQKGLDVLVIEKNSVGRHASGVKPDGRRCVDSVGARQPFEQ